MSRCYCKHYLRFHLSRLFDIIRSKSVHREPLRGSILSRDNADLFSCYFTSHAQSGLWRTYHTSQIHVVRRVLQITVILIFPLVSAYRRNFIFPKTGTYLWSSWNSFLALHSEQYFSAEVAAVSSRLFLLLFLLHHEGNISRWNIIKMHTCA